MAIDPITAIFETGKLAINKIWPDKQKQAEEQRKLKEIYQKGDLAELDAHVKLMLAQIEVNKKEAESKDRFVAGWRPFIGWVGGFSLAYAGIIHPLLSWLFLTLQGAGLIPQELTAPPYIQSGLLGTIVTGMLGIGGMRSYDKKQGTQTDKI